MKSLGVIDWDGREIYEDEDGDLFVFTGGERDYDPNIEEYISEIDEL